jgi:diacylglycerol kinase family enzyme
VNSVVVRYQDPHTSELRCKRTARGGLDLECVSTVNVSILCNESAGQGVSGERLRTLIERAGHTILHIIASDHLRADDKSRQVDPRVEVVVAAGGDGTVAAAAAMVVGTSTPLAILPLGTANNIASSLGIDASLDELVASWNRAHRMACDVAYARAASREWLVVEGAGGGLIPAGIAASQSSLEQDGRDGNNETATVTTALRTFYDVLRSLEPRRWTIIADGTRLSDDFLVVEVLNIPSIGPNLILAKDASASDGYLDVVVAGSAHRNKLLRYLERRIEGKDARLSLPQCRAREVQIESCEEVHIDDERVDTCQLGQISIRIVPAALTVLAGSYEKEHKTLARRHQSTLPTAP